MNEVNSYDYKYARKHRGRNTDPKIRPPKRIGAAKGKFTIPENFDEMDKDIEDLFADYL